MILLLLFSLACYASAWVPPDLFWPAAILSYATLPILAVNLLLVPILLIFRYKLVIWPLLALVAGAHFLDLTYNFGSDHEIPDDADTFSVMSFNAKFFRESGTYSRFSREMIQWMVDEDSDIKCIQEYSTNNQWEGLDITEKISAQGYFSHVYEADIPEADHHPGMAIFSRYPIINSGTLIFFERSVNNCIYTDIRIKTDTIRIYNLHLLSMQIPLYQYKNSKNLLYKVRSLIWKLRSDSVIRKEQLELLISHTENCPYPFIICGDFNEIPYGYNYQLLKRQFRNSLDEAGAGFGFTLSKKFFFLRIDHQFANSGIHVSSFQICRKMSVSDHFPLNVTYNLKHTP